MRLDFSVFRLPRKQSKTCESIGSYLRTPRMTLRMTRVDSEKLKTNERLDLTLDWHRLVIFSGKKKKKNQDLIFCESSSQQGSTLEGFPRKKG